MAENSKPKKIRLYKFASEYNLSTESLVEYLSEKGFKVKGHMSLLNEDMITEIQSKFKKEIEKAEKHYRKISEFNKMREERAASEGEESDEDVIAEKELSESEPAPEAAASDEDKEKTTAVEKVELESAEKEEEGEASGEIVEEPETEEKVKQETIEAAEDVQVQEEIEPETEPEKKAEKKTNKKEKVAVFKTEAELELEKNKKSLKVLGTVELKKETKRKTKKGSKSAKTEKEPEVKSEKTDKSKTEKTGDKAKSETPAKKRRMRAKKKSKKIELDPEEVKKAKKGRKSKKFEVDKKEVEAAIKRTMESMDASVIGDRAISRKKKRKEKHIIEEMLLEEKESEKSKLKVTEFIAVNELANLMDIPVGDVILKCVELGMMVTINQRLDNESITLVADEFGFEVEFEEEYNADVLADTEDSEESLTSRSPVVTIMGHVDHGKTSLLDHIRNTNVVAGEAGGITQHIGAYQVELENGRKITFLDTPGHEAFTAMRARGTKVTDIVVLVIAADDAVMPQTIEAINHAQAAGVPIIVAINKIDKPGANPERIRQQLSERKVLVEDWGGKYQCVEVSAKKGLNIQELMEKILLEAEMLDLKANSDRLARGTIIESQLDKGRGITATVLIEKGTLKIHNSFVAGVNHGRVRAMFDERNKPVKEAGPATPVVLLGFEGAPQAGDAFVVLESEREAREVANKRLQLKREQDNRQVKLITLDQIASQIGKGEFKELPVVVKGDVDGSVEALSDSLMKLTNEEVAVHVIHKGVGGISEGDVLLAAASGAIIVGFHVRPYTNARRLAETENVDIRLYNVIYDAIDEIKSALEGMLAPVVSEELTATLEVRNTFKVPKVGTIAGCYVTDGKITRKEKIRLYRDGIVIYEGELAALKRFKDDVKEVETGYECGVNIANYNDVKVGDVIEGYKFIETKKKLKV